MSRRLNVPYFPLPPRFYSQNYLAEIVRAFSVYLAQQQNPGEGRNTTLVLTDLPQDDYNLETGALFEQDGIVKITRANAPHVRGLSSTGEVGSVTVTTT
jgi:hypothetical protein